MKNITFQKLLFLLSFFFFAIPMQSQENKLKFHSASFGVGVLDTFSESSGEGFNVVADVAVQSKENLFSLYVNSGSGFMVGALFGDDSEDYLAGSLTYGRELELLDWIKLEGHAGVGFFHHNAQYERENIDIDKTSIGFPVRAKLIFFYKFIGFGLNQNVNLNPLVSTYSTDVILQIIF